jgi:CBS domain-containing protein
MTLREAATVLDEEDVGAVAVLGSDGLDGLLSERDIVGALAGGADPDVELVGTTMSDDPLSWVDAETSIGSAADLMIAAGVRHLPVLAGREVVGMVSIRDALDVVRSDQVADAGE